MSKSLAPLARHPRRIPAVDLDCVQPFASTSSSITRELLVTGSGASIGNVVEEPPLRSRPPRVHKDREPRAAVAYPRISPKDSVTSMAAANMVAFVMELQNGIYGPGAHEYDLSVDLDCVQPFASTSSSITRELLATGSGASIVNVVEEPPLRSRPPRVLEDRTVPYTRISPKDSATSMAAANMVESLAEL
ncbi:hypothetical protein K438DRAFT_1967395 [Mycena galopus ATCC 62051]|nr:hypothetical protein K438DRAFT_1967395 [Mycena galopus ATCC 62051]